MCALRGTARACALAAMLLMATQRVEASSIALAWDPNTESDLAGYIVLYGMTPGSYTVSTDVGNQTSCLVLNLTDGQQYYFAVQAYNTSGLRSALSTEVTATVVPPPRGLVAAFSFDQDAGVLAIDSSAGANHGSVSGAGWTAAGRFGGALSFDGIDDTVTVADSPSLHLWTSMTVEAWINPTELTAWRSVILKETANGLAYSLYANDNAPHPASTIRIAGIDYSAPGIAPVALNSWTHLASTYDGTAIRLFVNGVETASVPMTGAIDVSTNPLRIGGNSIWGEYFQGRIDEVRIYDKALTQAEIQVDMDTPVENGLVAAYNFDEGAGAVAADATGSGHAGTINGATWTLGGKFGNALRFDGVNDLVTVPDAVALDLTGRMTIEAWVYPTALSGWRTVVLKASGPALAYGLYANDNAPRPAMTVKVDGLDSSAVGTLKLPLNVWTHLASTYDGSTLRMFVNGTQVGSRALTGSITTSTDLLSIGGNLVWGEYFQGRIDDVRIYNRALSAAELQTDMQTPVVPR